MLLAVAPGLGTERGRELARRVLAVIVAGPTTGLASDPAAVRLSVVDMLRLHLAEAGVDPEAFDQAMLRG